ncbi:FK506-binding protein 2B [Desmophyllum pertusum]|uniref:peptidylprolyl isomerase n=1 Tax=Desmophyllum pertusum TaxID=174260 RepID=A0A9W9ZRQ0_9CNID|nr:FK506-binding protein 2B [Desmophyllum pertusum]
MAENEEIEKNWTEEQLHGEDVSKKDIIKYLHEHASFEFLKEHKLNGKLNNIAKTSKKDHLIDSYNQLFDSKAFRKESDASLEDQLKEAAEKTAAMHVSEKKKERKGSESKDSKKEEPKFTKKILKHGDKATFPTKGDRVSCFYIGKLENGVVFDSNISGAAGTKKKNKDEGKPFIFRVGKGLVIRGWDEGLLTMSKGEKSELTIEPEWGYGKKGNIDANIPPQSKLFFEVELVDVI